MHLEPLCLQTFTSSMTLSKLFNFSTPQFPHPYMVDNNNLLHMVVMGLTVNIYNECIENRA